MHRRRLVGGEKEDQLTVAMLAMHDAFVHRQLVLTRGSPCAPSPLKPSSSRIVSLCSPSRGGGSSTCGRSAAEQESGVHDVHVFALRQRRNVQRQPQRAFVEPGQRHGFGNVTHHAAGNARGAQAFFPMLAHPPSGTPGATPPAMPRYAAVADRLSRSADRRAIVRSRAGARAFRTEPAGRHRARSGAHRALREDR